MQFPVGFYLVALVFIVFDALAVFLFPWVLDAPRARRPRARRRWCCSSRSSALGWVYAYRERILEWK